MAAKWTATGVVGVFALCFAISAAAAAVEIHYEESFDGLAAGDADGQGGWLAGAPANQASTVITADENREGGGKSMEVSANQEVVREFDPHIASGVHFLSIWFKFANVDAANTLHIYMGDEVREWNAGPVIRIGSQSGGGFDEVGVHDGGAAQPVAPILEGDGNTSSRCWTWTTTRTTSTWTASSPQTASRGATRLCTSPSVG